MTRRTIAIALRELVLTFRLIAGTGNVFEQIELMVDESSVELPHAVRVPKEIRPSVRQIVARAIGNVMRNLDLFHLIAVDGVGTKIARNC